MKKCRYKMSNKERDRFAAICAYIQDYGEISKSKAAEILNVEDKTAQRLLIKAENLGLLIALGENKGRIYKFNTQE